MKCGSKPIGEQHEHAYKRPYDRRRWIEFTFARCWQMSLVLCDNSTDGSKHVNSFHRESIKASEIYKRVATGMSKKQIHEKKGRQGQRTKRFQKRDEASFVRTPNERSIIIIVQQP